MRILESANKYLSIRHENKFGDFLNYRLINQLITETINGKTIGDYGGRFLGNLSYGAARPSLTSRAGSRSLTPEEMRKHALWALERARYFKKIGRPKEVWMHYIEMARKYNQQSVRPRWIKHINEYMDNIMTNKMTFKECSRIVNERNLSGINRMQKSLAVTGLALAGSLSLNKKLKKRKHDQELSKLTPVQQNEYYESLKKTPIEKI